MSYNTRRSNYGTPQQSAAAVGQRRPVVTNNFVSGGQLSGSQQQAKPQQQQPQQQQQQQQRTPQQQQQSGISFRQNQQGQQPQQSYQTQSYSSTPQQQGRYQQGQSTPIKQEVKPVQQQAKPAAPAQAKPAPAPVVPGANPPAPDDAAMDSSGEGKKKFWQKNRVKISKAEKLRRRNLRLSKMLQPKNAVMILNELVKGCVYNVEELSVKVDANQFRGTVTFDGQEFAGTGRTKSAAKSAAAETALKHLVKNKQLISTPVKTEDGDGDEKMELGEDDESGVMPWSHIASFAMYKLFSTWGEDISLVNKVSAQDIIANNPPKQPSAQPKPAKKMPDNPETMNPMMLMHQMLPNAVWEEVGKSGVPPNVVFTFAVTVDGQQYTGTGSSKKIAKKMAAFSACHDILKVSYPPDVWTPLY